MSEIEFRGKRVDNGEWVYGFYFEIEHNDDKTHVHGYITANPLLEKMPESAASFIEVETKTVGQFTGEKDKEGQKLFKGDVIRSGYLGNKYLIKFVDGAFMGVSKNERGTCMALSNSVKLGNVHDNPELMEAE